MISLGSAAWTSERPNITLSFAYEKRRSGADMQYRAQITVSSVSGYSYFGYPIYVGIHMAGVWRESATLKNASPSQWTSPITFTSAWYTISNKTTGTTPLLFNVYSGLGSSRSTSHTFNMAVDPAAAEISAANGTLGTSLTLNLTRYNSSFTDTITYKCGSASGTVKSGSTSATVAWNSTNGNTVGLAAQNTSGQSVDVTFTVTTYSGSTVVGTNTAKVTMAIPNTVKPSVALSVSDAAGYLSTYGAYVQGYSKLKITATPTLAYGSPIKTYAITADGSSYATSPVTTAALKGKGTQPITAKVTDARTRTSDTVTQNITVLEYTKPVVNLTAYRCNSSGVSDAEGAYMKIVVTSTISSLNGKNSATYKVVHPGGTLTGSGTSFTSAVLDCDVSLTHNIEVTITDKLSSTTKAAVIPIAYTLMDYYQTGRGIALGKVATRDGFDCAMDAYFGNKRVREVGLPSVDSDAATPAYLKNNGLITAKWIEWADINTTTRPGWYRSQPPSGTSLGGITWSAAVWFRVDAYDSNAQCQTFYLASADGYIVRRQRNSGTWGAFECFNPPMTANVEYRTTERWNGKPVYTKLMVHTNSAAYNGVNTYSISHGISNLDVMISASCTTPNYFLPYATESTHMAVCYWNATVIQLYCNSTWAAGRTWYFTLKYTKTA